MLNCVIAPLFGIVGSVAEAVLIAPTIPVIVPEGLNATFPYTCQSPAVNVMLVIFAATFEVKATADPTKTVDDINSPTLPAAALLFVVVPIIPDVEVKLILVALADPKTGVINVGLLAKTKAPVPVSSVTVAAKLLLVGVAKNVAILAARPVIPVLTGNPVQLVKIPDCGVPKAGVTKVGFVANTNCPVPVSSVIAAARLALVGVARNVAIPVARPLIPVLTGRPVQFVKTPEVGVPNRGEVNDGVVANTKLPLPVVPITADSKLALVGVAKKVATPAPSPLTPVVIGSPVQFVRTPALGVPKAGVVNDGETVPAKAPAPLCPLREVFTALFVAIVFPYTMVKPDDWGAPCAVHVVLAVVHINRIESNRLVEDTLPPTPTVVEEVPI